MKLYQRVHGISRHLLLLLFGEPAKPCLTPAHAVSIARSTRGDFVTREWAAGAAPPPASPYTPSGGALSPDLREYMECRVLQGGGPLQKDLISAGPAKHLNVLSLSSKREQHTNQIFFKGSLGEKTQAPSLFAAASPVCPETRRPAARDFSHASRLTRALSSPREVS